jgi:quinol-cytochrome oxidoreductase complex cytochrome b subunit
MDPNNQPTNMLTRIKQSIFTRPLIPVTEKDRRRYLLSNLILHFRPTKTPVDTLRFRLSWGLGGMAVVLVVMQMGTGLLLKFSYEPSPASAYASIVRIIREVPFGALVRNMHHWGANLLAFIVFLHLLRVFYTGAFYGRRQFNWVVGLGLLLLVLLANFTGYLLPWDQLAFWAITICTGMLGYLPVIGGLLQGMLVGGPEITAVSLRVFYALHTGLVPLCLAGLMLFHFWRVRKAGGLVRPEKSAQKATSGLPYAPTVPDLIVRELATGLAMVALILLLAVFFNAPLGDPANPGLSPNPTKAPWYFAGLQELLLHMHPVFAVGIIPFLALVALVLIPYFNFTEQTPGVWGRSPLGRRLIWAAAALGTLCGILLALGEATAVSMQVHLAFEPLFFSQGVVPLLTGLILLGGFYWLMRRKFGATGEEAVQALFTLCVVFLIILTVTGVWFRGPEMKLVLPWALSP